MKVHENDQNYDNNEYDGLDVHFDRVMLVSVFDLNNVANPFKAFTLLQPERIAQLQNLSWRVLKIGTPAAVSLQTNPETWACVLEDLKKATESSERCGLIIIN